MNIAGMPTLGAARGQLAKYVMHVIGCNDTAFIQMCVVCFCNRDHNIAIYSYIHSVSDLLIS